MCIKNKSNNIFFGFAVSKAKIIGNTEMYIRSGSDINLTCVVLETPDPPTFIYWYRDRDVINYSGRGGISVVTEKQTRTSRLLISKAQPPDTGNYTCAPSASDSASVTVHVLNGEYIIIIIYTQDISAKMYYDPFECNIGIYFNLKDNIVKYLLRIRYTLYIYNIISVLYIINYLFIINKC